MIVNLDCYYKLSSNKLYRASKLYFTYWLEKSVTFSVQLIKTAIIQTTLIIMKIDHILFISFSKLSHEEHYNIRKYRYSYKSCLFPCPTPLLS